MLHKPKPSTVLCMCFWRKALDPLIWETSTWSRWQANPIFALLFVEVAVPSFTPSLVVVESFRSRAQHTNAVSLIRNHKTRSIHMDAVRLPCCRLSRISWMLESFDSRYEEAGHPSIQPSKTEGASWCILVLSILDQGCAIRKNE